MTSPGSGSLGSACPGGCPWPPLLMGTCGARGGPLPPFSGLSLRIGCFLPWCPSLGAEDPVSVASTHPLLLGFTLCSLCSLRGRLCPPRSSVFLKLSGGL